MKYWKKFAGIALALVMVLALAVPAFADDDGNYKITINAPESVSIMDQTFTAYKVFNVTYSEANNDDAAFTYTWAPGFDDAAFTVEYPEGTTIAHDDLLKWLEEQGNDSPGAIAFADAALAWAKAHAAVESVSEKAVSDYTVTINVTSKGAGYYVVDGGARSADSNGSEIVPTAILTTTNPARTVTLKADVPTVDKKILDKDNAGNDVKVDGTTRKIGDEVKFEVTSRVPDTTGYTRYDMEFTDTMSAGLKFNDNVVIIITTGTGATGSSNQVQIQADDITVTENPTGNITIKFNDLLATLTNHPTIKAGDPITITYSAILLESALRTDKETNSVKLEYSNNPKDTTSTATTPEKTVYVYDFDIVIDKFTGTGDAAQKLAGAQFKLKNEEDKYYSWKAEADGQTAGVVWVEDEADAKVVITDDEGVASFVGLAAGTYQLIEIEAPNGYNKIDDPIVVEITIEYNEDGSLKNSNAVVGENNGQYSLIKPVENNAGSLLPSTGGIGTTIFYIVGGVLLVGAVVLLITRRRTSVDDE